MASPVYRFTCNHVGRTADYAAGFIRVAEVRDANVTVVTVPCPDCKSAGQGTVQAARPYATDRSVMGRPKQ